VKSYTESEAFKPFELQLLASAIVAVMRMPDEIDGRWLRCHEVARAVGNFLDLAVCDGWYGMVEHSWLWTREPEIVEGAFLGGLPNILDVYVPGGMPQVQLIHTSSALPLNYRRGDPRTDIDARTVELLIKECGR
jgi:hypothetical protein